MSMFKDYLVECITAQCDVIVGVGHMETMTFEDICMLIYHVGDSQKQVFSTEELLPKLVRDDYLEGGVIYLEGIMTEKLAILMSFILRKEGEQQFWVRLVNVDANTGELSEHFMSRDIIEAADKCGMAYHLDIKHIQHRFRIREMTSMSDYFENYCQQRQVKSARNIG